MNASNKVVLFIRNGDMEDGNQNLSSAGMEQAIKTANYISSKIKEDSFDDIKIYVSPEPIAVETSISLVNNLKESDIKFSFRVIQYLYEYRRPNKEAYVAEIHDKKYPIKPDKTWDHFTKRIDVAKKVIERDLTDKRNDKKKQLVVIFGHPVFFSALFSNFVNQGLTYPKNYKEVVFQYPNCAISCAGLNKETNKWNIFFIGNVSHLEEHKTGNHVIF